ncbi:Putative AC9 transposase [Linum perenne]
MVRDIFGVPISTVPSDSAFSTSGRVLDSFRSSLSPSIVEALICSADWFRSANASFQDAVDLEDLTELEDVAHACVVGIDNGEDAEVNQPTTEEGNEDSANDEDDWDDFISCSDDDNQS